MKLLGAFSLTVLLVFLSGCVHAPPAPHFTAADYGPLPVHYEETIKQYFETALKDPFSAQYKFQKPEQGYTYKVFVSGGANNPGWLVNVDVNAKNSYGAYVGWKRYSFLIKDENIIWSQSPE